MSIKYAIIIVFVSIILQSPSYAYKLIIDKQLDNVVAGSQIDNNHDELVIIPFHLSRPNKSLDGEITLLRNFSHTTGSLIIQDGAQSNLRSLININAVNSPVQVLLNLNVNINSSVGLLEQFNIQGSL